MVEPKQNHYRAFLVASGWFFFRNVEIAQPHLLQSSTDRLITGDANVQL